MSISKTFDQIELALSSLRDNHEASVDERVSLKATNADLLSGLASLAHVAGDVSMVLHDGDSVNLADLAKLNESVRQAHMLVFKIQQEH